MIRYDPLPGAVVQILALWPFRKAPELGPLEQGLAQALPGLVHLVDPEERPEDLADAAQPLLLPYLPPHRLLEASGDSPQALARAWAVYGELVQQLQDSGRTAPARPVNLQHYALPQLVSWLVQPSTEPPPCPAPPDLPPPLPVDPLLAQLTLQFLDDHPAVREAYALLERHAPTDAVPYAVGLQQRCTPELLLAAMAERRLLAADLAEQQQYLQQQRQDLDHVLEDRDLLARQLNELNAGFEAFYEQASSDAGKLDWNRKRRAELELTLQLQQRELEALARQVKDQASLIQRSAAASETIMKLLAGALAD